VGIEQLARDFDKSTFLEQGLRSHATMTKEVLKVKVYGDIVLVTSRGKKYRNLARTTLKADE
jgi:hypothetical protein